MKNAVYLAYAYMRFHRITSCALIFAISLIIAAPIATRLVLSAAETSLGERAETTPLLLGARGSSLDLTLAALYFQGEVATSVTQDAVDDIWDSGLGVAIPIHTGFSAQSHPVVGTTLDYFSFRDLQLEQGRLFAQIGEVVIGSEVAAALKLSAGDTIITDVANLFDLTGSYPLELTISGVLEYSGTADDGVFFSDMNTIWIVAGIGHGHENEIDPLANQPTNPAPRTFQSITPENIDTFHLHQSSESLPVSAVLISPYDNRAETILQGRYLEADNPFHIIKPSDVIQSLLSTLFQIGRLLDVVILVVGFAAAVAIVLAIGLATQLRRQELLTFYRLGAHRAAIIQTVFAHFILIIVAGAALAATFLVLISWILQWVPEAVIAMAS